jgi:hypothetical protein
LSMIAPPRLATAWVKVFCTHSASFTALGTGVTAPLMVTVE